MAFGVEIAKYLEDTLCEEQIFLCIIRQGVFSFISIRNFWNHRIPLKMPIFYEWSCNTIYVLHFHTHWCWKFRIWQFFQLNFYSENAEPKKATIVAYVNKNSILTKRSRARISITPKIFSVIKDIDILLSTNHSFVNIYI